MTAIEIRGARVHNLRNVDIDIPHNRLVVVTGLSGSGKSSLAFDTLHAEGQRQYIESLSVYARQYFDQLERPDVDAIDGLQPTLCLDQRAGSRNPRSTVATITEIYDHLRLITARVGVVHCYQCGLPIQQQTTSQIADSLLRMPEGTKVMLMAPLARGKKGQHREMIAEIRKSGFVRVRIDGEIHDIDHLPDLAPNQVHNIDVVVDRIVISASTDRRLAESIQLAVKHGTGALIACHQTSGTSGTPSTGQAAWSDRLFSTRYACPMCEISYHTIEPRTFSFNSPHGACPVCEGLGTCWSFDGESVLPNLELSLSQGAIAPWKTGTAAQRRRREESLQPFLDQHSFDQDTPLSDWETPLVQQLLDGDGSEYPGVMLLLEKELATATQPKRLEQLESFRSQLPCEACDGSRLRVEARQTFLGGLAIHEITRLSVGAARLFFEQVELPADDRPVAQPLINEMVRRLRFLEKVGVDYLTLDRSADTLSGGEMQRVRLATSIGSGLAGVCYILDEPSVGLHPRDNDRLIQSLRGLQHQGNTVLVVEHDESMMRAADYLIDMGPGAGIGGGSVVSQGTPVEVMADEKSPTGRYLSGADRIEIPAQRRPTTRSRSLVLNGASLNNLCQVDARFPLEVLVCVTGVSGSGKSSLVNDTLAPAVARRLGVRTARPGPYDSLRGAGQIDKLVAIDQSPIGRSARSSAATYTGLYGEVRKVFKNTREARQRGYGVGRFSFNVRGGRCEACEGHGVQKIEMNFLPDLQVRCSVCHGARFNRQTLRIRYRGKSIADVLEMCVDEAIDYFENFPAIQRTLTSLQQIGLGYLPLGQPSTTLSGGEAQRIKLATQLARVETGNTLYILDEPTTGLHFEDIRVLLEVLHRLVEKGNTVVVIEHNLEVIKTADWIIDLGPEGGGAGGRVVGEGPPEVIAQVPSSHTGRYLAPLLGVPRSAGEKI